MLSTKTSSYIVDFCVGSVTLVAFLSVIHLVGDDVAQDRARYYQNFIDFRDAKSIPLAIFFSRQLFSDIFLSSYTEICRCRLLVFWSSIGYIAVFTAGVLPRASFASIGYVYSHFLLILFVITDRLVMDSVLNTAMSSVSVSLVSLGLFLATRDGRSIYVPNKFVLIGCAAHILAAVLLYCAFAAASLMPKKRLVMVVSFTCLIAFLSLFDFRRKH